MVIGYYRTTEDPIEFKELKESKSVPKKRKQKPRDNHHTFLVVIIHYTYTLSEKSNKCQQ